MFVNGRYDEVVQRLAGETVLELEIVPARYPHEANSPYRPGYDWLFKIEREVARQLDPWLRAQRYHLIGNKGLLCEALSNAFCHGHRKQAELPILVRAVVGDAGIMISILDAGPGFDVEAVLEKVRSGKQYYHIAGNGMLRLAGSQDFFIFYDQEGCRCNLVHLFDGHTWQGFLAPERKQARHQATPSAPFEKIAGVLGVEAVMQIDDAGLLTPLSGQWSARQQQAARLLAETYQAADGLIRHQTHSACESVLVEAEKGMVLLLARGRMLWVVILDQSAPPARVRLELLRILQTVPQSG
jgi:anti-sigma regulatory factor (Ser/Thr protein kinase)/predicted regulator of Ras-like GTPase activity (Roadblock/LC7/MglB family)